MPTPATDRPEVDLPEKERYTDEDYQQLPEGAPYELVHGHLVRFPSPSPRHQIVQSNLFYELSRFVRESEHGRVFSAPLDVRLSDTNVLQPDLLFVSQHHLDRIGEQRIHSAPDLIAEILSPATAHRDLTEKKRLYEEQGVPEYWVVDPDPETVGVFRNTDDGFVQEHRVVERGLVSSTVLNDFDIALDDLFEE